MDNDLMDLETASSEEERTAFGALDKLVVNGAMIAACVVPTMIIGLVTPWRLTPLITADEPTGRRGVILAPGLFFLVAIIGSVFLAGAAFTDALSDPAITQTETIKKTATFFGTRDAMAVAQAVAQGEFTKVLLVIAPIFLLAVFSAVLSRSARPLLDERWTMQASIRAWLYFTGIAISFIFLMFALAKLASAGSVIGNSLSGDVPMLLFLLYFFASIFRKGFKAPAIKTSAATGVCLVSLVLLLVSIIATIRA